MAFHRSHSGLVTIPSLDTESAIIAAALVSRAVGIYFRSGPKRPRSGLCPLYNEAEFNKG